MKLVSKGMTDKEVTWIKETLTSAGFYQVEEPEEFGTVCDLCVKAFQTAKGLKVDGIVGDATRGELSKFEPKTNPTVIGMLTGDQVNVRTGPGTNYQSVTKVDRGTKVEIIGTDGSWTKVKYDGKELWIYSQYVTPLASGNLKSEFVEYAMSWVNVGIYIWGGQGEVYGMNDPLVRKLDENFIIAHESGEHEKDALALFRKRVNEGHKVIRCFDCSGYIIYWLYLLKKLVKRDYSANGIYETLCKPIKKSEIVPGDLGFKKDKSGHKYHVGICVGNNKIVHAKGREYGVVMETINSSWDAWGRLNCLN